VHQVDRIIEAPAGVAWRILIDTREWPIWGPSVRAVEAPAQLIGPGMRGRIQTPLGLWLPFEVTRWEPGHAWSWRVAGVDATGHRVTPLGPALSCHLRDPALGTLLSLGLRCGLAPDRDARDSLRGCALRRMPAAGAACARSRSSSTID
jgi:hypothetical protein